ncbi:MAG TPA: BON domain-containing protein [Gemmatimonadales bacterium]|jgi:hypothetical protein|nr:BON domain-containing protein [Gemmatimonadales bacterium]
MTKRRSSSDVTLALLTGLGIGGALMFFLDPRGGARRRAVVRDRTARAMRAGRDELRQDVQDARNRISGMVAEARGRLRHETVDDEQLVARVRADLGHWTDRAGAIEVAADRGTVTLRGEVSREAVGDMLSAVRRVPGVERVVNHLTVRETSAGSFAGPRPD